MHRTLLVILLPLCGCGLEPGWSFGPPDLDLPPPLNPAIWSGSLFYAGGTVEPCVGVGYVDSGFTWVLPWEDGRPKRRYEAYVLEFPFYGGAIEGASRFYDAFGRALPVGKVTGTVKRRDSAAGSIEEGVASGFSLQFDPLHDEELTRSELVGTWSSDDGNGYSFDIEIREEGGGLTFVATTSDGEELEGQLDDPKPGSRIHRVEGQANLGSVTLSFAGVATILDGETLLLALSQTVLSGGPLSPTTIESRVHWARR